MTQMANATEQLTEYEDGLSAIVLDISKRRRLAQAALIRAFPTIVGNAVEAHTYLMTYGKSVTNPEFQTVCKNLILEHGYDIRLDGIGFSGYMLGPMVVGGPKGQLIAKERGSLLAEGVLVNDTDAGARLYASHLCSYCEYKVGEVTFKVTNPGSSSPLIETDPPEAYEQMKSASS